MIVMLNLARKPLEPSRQPPGSNSGFCPLRGLRLSLLRRLLTDLSWVRILYGPSVDKENFGSGSSNKHLLIYLSGSPGTNTGKTYNGQTPLLPFTARYHVQWLATGTSTNAWQYSGGWVDASWNFTGDVASRGNFVEMRIPLADIDSPATLGVHLSLIDSAGNSTYGGGALNLFHGWP
jgi:hypothetical protein